MFTIKTAVLAVASVAVIVLTACGSSGGDATAPTSNSTSNSSSTRAPASMTSMPPSSSGTAGTATVTNGKITLDVTNELRFMPSTIMVPQVGKVTVTLKDTGSYPHNISVPSLHATSKSVSGTIGEQTTSVTFDFAKKGRYPFVCTYHDQAGMRGVFVVG